MSNEITYKEEELKKKSKKLEETNKKMLEKTLKQSIDNGASKENLLEITKLLGIELVLPPNYIEKYDKSGFKINRDKKVIDPIKEEKIQLKDAKANKPSFKNNNKKSSFIPDYVRDGDILNKSTDIVALPSKGEVYKNKKAKIMVAFLNASDEDLITSPNMYADGNIVDYLIARKVAERNFPIEDMCRGDRDALAIWLRATGYGYDFPISIHDSESNTDFDTSIDLSKLNFKPFNLKGDENGFFDYKLPQSEDEIKFKFLSISEEKELKNELELQNDKLKKFKLQEVNEILKMFIKNDENIQIQIKNNLNKAIGFIEDWDNSIVVDDNQLFSKNITNTLKKHIVSINGDTDKEFIEKYVNNMKTIDSLSLRKYIMENEPGIDFKIEVPRPETLGGGSITTFLKLDSTIFLNIA